MSALLAKRVHFPYEILQKIFENAVDNHSITPLVVCLINSHFYLRFRKHIWRIINLDQHESSMESVEALTVAALPDHPPIFHLIQSLSVRTVVEEHLPWQGHFIGLMIEERRHNLPRMLFPIRLFRFISTPFEDEGFGSSSLQAVPLPQTAHQQIYLHAPMASDPEIVVTVELPVLFIPSTYLAHSITTLYVEGYWTAFAPDINEGSNFGAYYFIHLFPRLHRLAISAQAGLDLFYQLTPFFQNLPQQLEMVVCLLDDDDHRMVTPSRDTLVQWLSADERIFIFYRSKEGLMEDWVNGNTDRNDCQSVWCRASRVVCTMLQ
jgi:hypothetical protein